MTVSAPLRMIGKASTRRRTGGEPPDTSRQQPTCNDSKRQGRSSFRSVRSGHGPAVLVLIRQRPQVRNLLRPPIEITSDDANVVRLAEQEPAKNDRNQYNTDAKH